MKEQGKESLIDFEPVLNAGKPTGADPEITQAEQSYDSLVGTLYQVINQPPEDMIAFVSPEVVEPFAAADRHPNTSSQADTETQLTEEQIDLIIQNIPMANTLYRRFMRRGVPQEDLQQVAYIGLIKAVKCFNPELGFELAAFASKTIHGEIKRYFRDYCWQIKPPRSIQERYLLMRDSRTELTQKLGREPNEADYSGFLGLGIKEVREVLNNAKEAYRAVSIDGYLDESSPCLYEQLPDQNEQYKVKEDNLIVSQLIGQLDDRAQRIVRLRYYECKTQQEIAKELGISQMHVSRLLAKAHNQMHQIAERLGLSQEDL